MAVQPAELVLPEENEGVDKGSLSLPSTAPNDREGLNDNLKWSCMKQLLSSLAGIALIVVQLQIAISNGGSNPWPIENSDPIKETLDYFRIAISLLTLLSVYYLFNFYKHHCSILIAKNLLPADSTVFSSDLNRQFLLEALFLSIHPFPTIDSVFKSPHFYLAFTLFPFARMVYVARAVSFWSALNSANGRFIGALTSVDFTSSFMLKTALRNHPGRCILFCLLALLFFAGYALYVTERVVCSYERETDPFACGGLDTDLLSFWDAQWILIITILTVGYGDLYPYTHGGRFIAVSGGLMGTLMTAVTIALTTDYLNLSRSESKVVSFLKKNSNKKLVFRQATRSVQAAYRSYLARKKPEFAKNAHPQKKLKGNAELTHHLYTVLSEFRSAKRYAIAHDGSDPVDKQITMLETMEVNLDEMKGKVEMLLKHHHNTFSGGGSKDYPPESQAQNEMSNSAQNEMSNSAQNEMSNSVDCGLPDKHGTDSSVPRWAAPLEVTFGRIIQEISGLGEDISRVKMAINEQVAENTRRTDARLDELEKKIQMLMEAKAE